MCIPHVRVGSYAHQHESGISAQIFEILLQGRFLILVGFFFFVSFSKVLFIYLRERREKKHD